MTQFKQHQKPNTTLFDDDNRIDWERRRLKKRSQDGLSEDDYSFGLDEIEVELTRAMTRKKGKRSRRQHFIMDEEVGVVTKRRRKDGRHYDEWEDYD